MPGSAIAEKTHGPSRSHESPAQMVKKDRMISFRVSSEEFEMLKRMYRTYGHTSISELARSAVQRLVAEEPVNTESVHSRLDQLNGKVHDLDQQVSRLSALLVVTGETP